MLYKRIGIGTCAVSCYDVYERKNKFIILGLAQFLLSFVGIGYLWALYMSIGAIALSQSYYPYFDFKKVKELTTNEKNIAGLI